MSRYVCVCVCRCVSHFNCTSCIFKGPLLPSTLDRCNEIRLHSLRIVWSAHEINTQRGKRRWRRLTVGPQMRSHYLTHKDASRAHYVPAPLLSSVNEPNEASRTLTHAHKSFIMYTTTDNDLWINWCKHLRHAHTHQQTSTPSTHSTHDSRRDWESRLREFECELMQRTLNAIIHHFTKAPSQNTLRKCLWHTNTHREKERVRGRDS